MFFFTYLETYLLKEIIKTVSLQEAILNKFMLFIMFMSQIQLLIIRVQFTDAVFKFKKNQLRPFAYIYHKCPKSVTYS